MKCFAIYDLVGISVADDYPWQDTLFVAQGISREGEALYRACAAYVDVVYTSKLDLSDTRFIGDNEYIGRNIYIDKEYGVRVERLADNRLKLICTQECNEWLVIALQLMLLQSGYSLIHAAGVEKDGKVLLMPAWGGVGKTATVCKFIRQYGWHLLGDDLVIIGHNKVKPFLKPFVIYPYHKNLFPELFDNGENHTVKNLKLSSAMSALIPTVKRVLRPFPHFLAYLRKHNPQSMRVSPHKIFQEEQISKGGTLFLAVWLERVPDEQQSLVELSPAQIVSKALTVSSTELFAEKLDSIFHMCGCGMFSYAETIGKMEDIMMALFEAVPCSMIEIPVSEMIDHVGDRVFDMLKFEV